MTHRKCTCGSYDPFDPDAMCEYCHRRQEWADGDGGDPSCSICGGRGHYVDGDPLAGVQWTETCECVANRKQ